MPRAHVSILRNPRLLYILYAGVDHLLKHNIHNLIWINKIPKNVEVLVTSVVIII